jgi:transketolase
MINLNKVRKTILKIIHHAGSGHPGSSLSLVELLSVLCCEEISWNLEDRSKLILSKGHGVPALYAVFYQLGLISDYDLETFRTFDSKLQGHPDKTKLNLLDAGTGALGQGLSIAIGYALAFRFRNSPNSAYCILGDGELQEGQIWEAAMFASANCVSNLCVFVDNNDMQNERKIVDTLPMGDLIEKWNSFGWKTLSIDGHNLSSIRDAISTFKSMDSKPTIVFCKTVKGKGISFMENNPEWHGKKITDNDLETAMEELKN